MSLRLCVLASGSSGNCTVVASDTTRLLIDAGLSLRELTKRLGAIELRPEDLQAVCLSHEHNDHRAGLGVLHRRTRLPVYGNAGTIDALRGNEGLYGLPWNVFTTGSPFRVGDLTVEPFSVPHDSYDPVGFVVINGKTRVGVVTDMGMPTDLVRVHLRDCQCLVIESNHDERLLRDARRPWSLKQRIAGRQGHLSNTQAGELLVDVAGPHLRVAVLAHISEECNRPELAADTVRKALAAHGHHGVQVKVTHADRNSELIELEDGEALG